ncbi:hypothetical protein BBJ29_009920 [Phytophthora kernoviae]|uniref:Uncharacterized protein n=1 Tax=Phytophthora kernoviae TaxID=325452 RepID=A0A3F2RB79_9STRA|nr:hypothetical protein BBJ29_009920 [Phytophthora kernoviae]RLN51327.1 hypothetical protein BBP00_00009909 [Phytophthora kernoviae]
MAAFPIVRVQDDADLWFKWSENRMLFGGEVEGHYWEFILGWRLKCAPTDRDQAFLPFVQELHRMRIGEIASKWDDNTPMEYRHAKIKVGDVFEFYTSNDGVLEVPKWMSFKFAVEEFLETTTKSEETINCKKPNARSHRHTEN